MEWRLKMALFSRRHYNFLAAFLNIQYNETYTNQPDDNKFIATELSRMHSIERNAINLIIYRLANALIRDNPSFNYDQFIDACHDSLAERCAK